MSRNNQAAREIISPKDLSPVTDNENPNTDVREIMARIRDQVRADSEKKQNRGPEFRPLQAEQNREGQRKAGELLYSEELRHLNTHYGYSQLDPSSIVSHRGGPIGKLIVRLKRKFLLMLRDSILKEYLEREREFQASVVRYLNDVAKYVDARDASNFWELIRKIDVDISRALERIERIGDEQSASLASAERRVYDTLDERLKSLQQTIGALQAEVAEEGTRLGTLESVAGGLESILARAVRQNQGTVQEVAPSSPATEGVDYSYLLLENRFRGSEEDIKDRLRVYPPYYTGASNPVLEIGCGRGELLSLFAESSITAKGVDLDAAMVEAATSIGHDVALADGIAHLAGFEDHSLAGVIAVQVVEHLRQQQLEELCRLCARKVVPGGRIIFETINPRSVQALSSNYFRDPTHVFPQHPDTLSYVMTLSGLEVEEVRELSPVPHEAKLQEVPHDAYMTPRWAFTVDAINRNLEQLNALLYGSQDYCVVGRVPVEEKG